MTTEASLAVQAMLTAGNFTPNQMGTVHAIAELICKEREALIHKEINRLNGVIKVNDAMAKKALADMQEMARSFSTLSSMPDAATHELASLQDQVVLLEGRVQAKGVEQPTGATMEYSNDAALQATREILKHLSAGTDRADAERYRWACTRGMFSVRAANGTYSLVAAVGKAELDLYIDNGRKLGGMPTINR